MPYEVTVISVDFDSGEQTVRRKLDKTEFTIGRHPSNDIVLKQPDISGYHAKIRVETNGHPDKARFFVTDLGSANGTMVENKFIDANDETELDAQDRVIIGSYLLKPTWLEGSLTTSPSAIEKRFREIVGEAASNDLLSASENVEIEVPTERSAYADYSSIFGESEGLLVTTAGTDESDEVPALLDTAIEDANDSLEPDPEERSALDMLLDEEFVRDDSVVDSEDAIAAIEAAHEVADELEVAENLEQIAIPEQDAKEEICEILSHESDEIDSQVYAEDRRDVEFINGLLNKSAEEIPEEHVETETTGELEIIERDFTATRLLTITGTARCGERALADVRIDAGELGTTYTDADGHFSFTDIEEESHFEITAAKDGYSLSADGTTGTLEDDRTISFTASKLISLRGIIRHKGVALAGVTVDAGEFGTTVTDEDGVYVFENVPEDADFTISATKDGYRFS